MAILPIDTATRIALARHLRFARRMAQLHLLAARQSDLGSEIAASIAWDACAKELRAALQLARIREAERLQRGTVKGSDPRD